MNSIFGIKPRANETAEEFKWRVLDSREALSLTWTDVADILNDYTGERFTSDKYRKEYKKEKRNQIIKGVKDLVSADDEDIIIDDVKNIPSDELIVCDFDDMSKEEIDALIDAKKEKMKVQAINAQAMSYIRRLSREETLKDIAKDATEKMMCWNPLPLPTPIKSTTVERVGILQLSDIHYGLVTDTMWNAYDPDIAKERIERLQNKVIEYIKKEKLDTIYLVNLGDMISGRIHSPLKYGASSDVVTQTMEISEIIAEFTNNLSHYAKIKCYFTTDNHSRIEPDKKEALNLESLSRFTPWFMKTRLKDNKNVELFTDEKYGDDIAMFKVFDFSVAACHGDKDKPNKILTNLSSYTKTHFDLILSGHFHHTALEEKNDTIIIYNGSVVSTDDYAEKLRLYTPPSQNLIICTKDVVMECLYKIRLD